KVLRTIRKQGKIIVDGLNIIKKHTRPKKEGEKGERVEIPAPINVSNVMLVCPHCSKGTRVGYSVNEKAKTRICKKCGKEIE
ncbi:MAG TPA: 50S ribosomal protein L24, partial [Candidatus Moranbacteria bacterium]|nr:50S ribosomal protein L24 [Candidatus Moranbacteria bacterium]